MPKLISRPTPRALVSIFVAFHLFVVALFSFPSDHGPLRYIREILSPYMIAIGMNEAWDTFAPRPKAEEQFLKALVVRQSGKTEVYSFPRMEALSYMDRYRMERFRKFQESVACNGCAGLWPDIDRNIARELGKGNDPVARVVLTKFESTIAPASQQVGDDKHAVATVLSVLSIPPEDRQ